MAKANLTTSANIAVSPREVDFVTRFENNWNHLRQIMGIIRPIKKTPGTVLKSKKAIVTLQSGAVGEGESVPYSQAQVVSQDYTTIGIEKFKKAVSIEAISDHGYEAAVQMTDDQFLFELQTNVTDRFYRFLSVGTLRKNADTFQMALSRARSAVLNRWMAMHKTTTNIVGFCNIDDIGDYLGAATVGAQVTNENGITYLRNFLGFGTLIACGDHEIPKGTIIATPSENIVLYFIDPGDPAFAQSDLVFTTGRGETNLIGVNTRGNYDTIVSEITAIMGMEMFAEYIDGIAVVTFGSTPDSSSAKLASLNVGSLALTPPFSPDTTTYTASTTNAQNLIAATPEADGATVAITNGSATVTNGSPAKWTAGSNTLTVAVTNGSASKTYTVTVTKN